MATWIPHFSSKVKAKYLQIAEAIEEDIKTGLLYNGDKLPSQRDIAKALAVDLTTVTRALNEVKRRGLINAKKGQGTLIEIASDFNRFHQKSAAFQMVDMSMNIPPHIPSLNDYLSSTLHDLLQNPQSTLNLNYQDSRGNEYDRNTASLWLKQRLGTIEGDRILVTSGAQTALASLCDLLFKPGALICTGEVTYPGFKAIAFHQELKLTALKMDEYGIVPEAFEDCCRMYKPQALYVIPTMDNPTTATIPDVRRDALVSIACTYDVTIIEDDPYSPLDDQSPNPFVVRAPERTWHIASLSKCLTPALRIAYIVAPELKQTLHLSSVLRASSLMSSPLMAATASRWIRDGSAEQLITEIKKESSARQSLAKTLLADFSFAAHPQGHHLWLFLPHPWNAAEFSSYASNLGIGVIPSHVFSVGGHSPNAVRIALGSASTQLELKKSLQLLIELMNRPPLATRIIV
ncbi:aminotransferase-like domain-containing protein [Legionella fallonii]|uniref:2-aminoadipate transaminase n=1 Tax=Legionella fallonii LLAP-10 TaxID=1212491 RepID=A0A098G7G1_9GAMM|nr:PLP-dependent aminotransferase family protein [Legionella fallonii]CEG58398.1 2-aminoadipate transaminase [Legionella fallonii LLAP-10]